MNEKTATQHQIDEYEAKGLIIRDKTNSPTGWKIVDKKAEIFIRKGCVRNEIKRCFTAFYIGTMRFAKYLFFLVIIVLTIIQKIPLENSLFLALFVYAFKKYIRACIDLLAKTCHCQQEDMRRYEDLSIRLSECIVGDHSLAKLYGLIGTEFSVHIVPFCPFSFLKIYNYIFIGIKTAYLVATEFVCGVIEIFMPNAIKRKMWEKWQKEKEAMLDEQDVYNSVSYNQSLARLFKNIDNTYVLDIKELSENQIALLCNPEFNLEQIKEIKIAIDDSRYNNVTNEDIRLIADPKFSAGQIRALRIALENVRANKLSMEQFKYMLNKNFDEWQINEITLAFCNKLTIEQVETFADLPDWDMKIRREEIKK